MCPFQNLSVSVVWLLHTRKCASPACCIRGRWAHWLRVMIDTCSLPIRHLSPCWPSIREPWIGRLLLMCMFTCISTGTTIYNHFNPIVTSAKSGLLHLIYTSAQILFSLFRAGMWESDRWGKRNIVCCLLCVWHHYQRDTECTRQIKSCRVSGINLITRVCLICTSSPDICCVSLLFLGCAVLFHVSQTCQIPQRVWGAIAPSGANTDGHLASHSIWLSQSCE